MTETHAPAFRLPLRVGRKAPHQTIYDANETMVAAGMTPASAAWLVSVAAEAEKLRAHILDIDAHATPYADLPQDPGYVGVYLVTAGSLHRALGTITTTSPSCQAEAERNDALAAIARVRALHTEHPIYELCDHDEHAPGTHVVELDDLEGQPTETCKTDPAYSVCGHCCMVGDELGADHVEWHDAADCWTCPTLRALESPAPTVPRLRVAEYTWSPTIRTTGQAIGAAAGRLLADAGAVVLDFSGVVAITATCADALVAELADDAGRITSEGMNDDVTSVFREVVQRREVEGWPL